MVEDKKKIYLIDGHSYAYRAFHAIRQLTDSRGLWLNAVYGFVRMLLKLIREEEPDYIAVAFDTPGETFRHRLYDDYKANRAEQPEEMRHQIPLIKEVVDAFKIPIFEADDYEADDVLATLAACAESQGIEAIIVTSDKDMFQLISDNVKVLNPHKEDILYDADEVRDRFGVGPEKMRDLLALAGDTSDNVPGVPGVGPKTAAALLNEYGSLEQVLERVDEISGQKRRENLRQNKESARLSQRLVTLVSDVPIEIDIEACKLKDFDKPKLIDLFTRFEFRSIVSELSDVQEKEDVDYSIISDDRDLNQLVKQMKKCPLFCIDFVTIGNDSMRAEVVGISIATDQGVACYIPVGHSTDALHVETEDGDEAELFGGKTLGQLDAGKVLNCLKPVLEDYSIKKVGHDIKRTMVLLMQHDIELRGADFDTMVESYLLNPSRQNHNLDNLALEFLNHKKTTIERLVGKGTKRRTMDNVGVREAADYACENAGLVLRLKGVLDPLLEEKGLHELYEKVEIPLTKILANMELRGVAVDIDVLQGLSTQLSGQLDGLREDIYMLAGQEFNINSTQQLGKILFEEMKLPVVKKIKTGYSTDMAVLKKLSAKHEMPRKVLEYRTLAKLKSTYIDALPLLVNPSTGRIHTSFNQAVTATGRLSSSEPNLQNIPIRSEMGREIRRAFVPSDDDKVLLSADYSQIELRILAHLSDDEELCEAFRQGVDIHDQTSSKIFDVPLSEVTSEMRRKAKVANYGILYGMSAAKLAADVGIERGEADSFIEHYFEVLPRVKEYIDSTIEEVRRNGYVTTIMNRRRYIPDINSRNVGVKRFAERTAINTPIQGSAADLIKMAMIQVDRQMADSGLASIMILQVHDELLFEVPANEVQRMKSLVKEIMESAYPLKAPVVADVRVGRNWLEAHD